MILIIPLVLFLILKLAGIWIFAEASWWWLVGGAVFAFVWFEFLERLFGLDAKKQDLHYDTIRKERVKRAFNQKNERNR